MRGKGVRERRRDVVREIGREWRGEGCYKRNLTLYYERVGID